LAGLHIEKSEREMTEIVLRVFPDVFSCSFLRSGNIRLSWKLASDNEAVMGYEIWRSDDGGKAGDPINGTRTFAHVYSITTSMWTEHLAAAGNAYQYYIRAYDLAGNKSVPSNVVDAELPLEVALPVANAAPIARPSFMKPPLVNATA